MTLAAQLAPLAVTQSNLFGMPVLVVGRRPICGLTSDGIMFKLDPESEFYAAVRLLDGARLFAPQMKDGRRVTMKNWVIVPFAEHDRYFELAQESFGLVTRS